MFKPEIRKTNKIIKKFCLSENDVIFIKKYVFSELKITSPIDTDILDEIIDLASQWELNMLDPLSVHGCDKTYDYPEKERDEMADKFVGEITGQWNDEKLIPDFEDLYKRLGLL